MGNRRDEYGEHFRDDALQDGVDPIRTVICGSEAAELAETPQFLHQIAYLRSIFCDVCVP